MGREQGAKRGGRAGRGREEGEGDAGRGGCGGGRGGTAGCVEVGGGKVCNEECRRLDGNREGRSDTHGTEGE